MVFAGTGRLLRGLAAVRWALSRWPRRPELDEPEGRNAWARFRRRGGITGLVHDAFRRRLTPAGKTLCGIWFAAFVVSRVPGWNLADLVFALTSAAFAAAWILSSRRPPLEAAWRLDGPLAAGGTSTIVLELRNAGRRRVRDPGAWFFRCADGLVFPGDGLHVAALEPGESATLRVPVHGRFRGPAFLDAPHLLALEPLGLMRASRRGAGGGAIAVRPGEPRLLSFRFLETGGAGAVFASALGARTDRMGDPAGTREYRVGDSPRDLHHRSWARLGRPVARERTSGRSDGIRLVVSSAAGGMDERMLVDGTLAVACAAARWLQARGALREVRLDGDRLEGGLDLAEALLDACARVPRSGWKAWRRPPLVVPDGGGRAPVLVFANALPEAWESGNPSAKAVVPDWMTDSVQWDAAGSVLRYRPDLPFEGEIRL